MAQARQSAGAAGALQGEGGGTRVAGATEGEGGVS